MSEHLFKVNMLKCIKDCLNLHGSIFVICLLVLLKKTSSKKSFLVVSDTLRVFVNILTPDDRYSLSVTASG